MPICHLVSAGSFAPEQFHPEKDDYIIACDGGLAHLSALGILPDLIVGDFDSFDETLPESIPTVHLPKEKDDTDTLFALRQGFQKGYRRFAFHGCLGGARTSHTIANLQLLTFLSKNGADGVIYGENTEIHLLKNRSMTFPAASTGYLSVLSLSSTARVRLSGLKYPFDGILSTDMPLGVSNEFIGETAEISVLKGSVLVILENN